MSPHGTCVRTGLILRRKRPRYKAEQPDDFPAPTSAILRIWTPLLNLLKDKFAPLDEEDEDEDGGWPEWFASECAAVIRETSNAREIQGPSKAVVPPGQDAHEADYWLVPSYDEAEPTVKRDVQAEETTYLASLAGWLVHSLSQTTGSATGQANKKRKRRGEEEVEMDGALAMEEGSRRRVARELVEEVGVRAVRDAVKCYEGTGDVSPGPR